MLEITVDQLLRDMVKIGASDLHISAGNPPIIRLQGRLTKLKGYKALSPETVESMLTGILTGVQNERLIAEKELDFSYSLGNMARFRGSIFMEYRALGAVFRMIPPKPLPLEELGVPSVMKELAHKRQGLILVTGPTSSGKTTTLASVIEYMNNHRNSHIVTIEDPIEYVFKNRTCLIRQREVGIHTHSFARALKSTLRQDPDVIFVGEMRDKETISTVLTAAETGHLVFSTLHTNNAVDTIHRLIDVFEPSIRNQICIQVASSLLGVFSQLLLPHKDSGKGMVLATEVLIVTPAIRNMIREERIHQIKNALITGGEYGMQSMEESLKKLYDDGKITLDVALNHAFDVEYFKELCGLTSKKSLEFKRKR